MSNNEKFPSKTKWKKDVEQINLVQTVFVALVSFAVAYVTVALQTSAKEEREALYVAGLVEALKHETTSNANLIRLWWQGMQDVAKDLENFVNQKGSQRPLIRPRFSGINNYALDALVRSEAAPHYVDPCVLSMFALLQQQVSAAIRAREAVDVALSEYTVTFAMPIEESYIAAARLQTNIERLLEIYEPLKEGFTLVDNHEHVTCEGLINAK